MYDWKNQARRLKHLRGAFRLTEHDMARIAGVTLRTWRKWENGSDGPRRSLPYLRIVSALGISGGWLLDGHTIEQMRKKARYKLAMDESPDLKAEHQSYVAALVAKADQHSFR